MYPLLTFSEVADMLNCSKHTVERLARDRVIPVIKIRRSTRFHVDDVQTYITNNRAAKGGNEEK
jgi:excisionase family DNA binding protein